MRNLVLLAERRHRVSLPLESGSAGRPSSEKGGTDDDDDQQALFVCSIARDPAAPDDDDDDDHHDGGTGEPTAFLLTPSGLLVATNGADAVCWSIDLNAAAVSDDDADPSGEDGAPSPPPGWFDAAYVEDTSRVVCLSRSGHVIAVDPRDGASELVGTFDFGLEDGGWSPDGEVLALYARVADEDGDEEVGGEDEAEGEEMSEPKLASVLMTMNANFEVLAEVRVENSVRRSSGDGDEAAVSLCWRPDGSALAVSSLDDVDDAVDSSSSPTPLRRVRTYARASLDLVSVGRSEDGSGADVPNLLPSSNISWSGGACSHLLAAVQRKGKRASSPRQVVFFEPNGLRHREFKLRPSSKAEGWGSETVTGLTWDDHGCGPGDEGGTLAVTLLCEKDDTEDDSAGDGPATKAVEGRVQLWRRSNYHWYLKREFRYPEREVTAAAFEGGRFRNFTVALRRSGGGNPEAAAAAALEYREYALLWDASTVHPATGVAAVIDGASVNFTPLGSALVPPPMSASSLELRCPVNAVVPAPLLSNGGGGEDGRGGSGIEWAAHLSDGTVAFLGTPSSSTSNGDGGVKIKSMGVPGFTPPRLLVSVDLNTAVPDDGTHFDRTALRDLLVLDVRPAALAPSVTIEENGNGGRDGDVVVVQLVGVEAAERQGGGRSDDAGLERCGERLVGMRLRLRPDGDGDEDPVESVRFLPVEGGHVLRLARWSDDPPPDDADELTGGAMVELSDGSLFEYECGDDRNNKDPSLLPSEAEPLLEPCPWISALRRPERFLAPDAPHDHDRSHHHHHHHHSKRVIVGLSARSRLYLSDRLLSPSTSSFHLSPHHAFLAHVTIGSRSQLRHLPLRALSSYDPLSGSPDGENAILLGEGYEPRDVERGSRLVAVLPGKPSAVLQMSRGNLEGVYPRALVLPHAMRLLRGGEFGTAVELMRRQKVDLNLVVDIDPAKFLGGEGVRGLIDQVRGVDRLNLFLSNLTDEDITRWKYPVPEWLPRLEGGADEPSGESSTEEGVKEPFDFTTKVNAVCSAVREAMLRAERDGVTYPSGRAVKSGHFLLPILSTFAKERPPRLEDALGLIRENAFAAAGLATGSSSFSSAPSGSGGTRRGGAKKKHKSPLLTDAAQSSIQYLAFLADYQLLFDTALGMYDYDLARAVARNSPAMDPKVYLPLLKRLGGLRPECKAKYEVDVRLGRYESALRNLVRMGEIEEEEERAVINGDVEADGGVTPTLVAADDTASSSADERFQRCLSFIKAHKLHRLALELYDSSQPEKRRRVIVSLGERLLGEGKGDEASSVFLSADPPELEGAKNAARMCGDWRTFFACAVTAAEASSASGSSEAGAADNGEDEGAPGMMSAGKRRALAAEIADEIAACQGKSAAPTGEDMRRGAAEAARILLDYASDQQDVTGAVDMLIKAQLWTEGRRVALLRGREDLVKRVADGAEKAAVSYLEGMKSRSEAFEESNARYGEVVRIRRAAGPDGNTQGGDGMAGGDAGGGDGGSLFSEASRATDASIRSDLSGSSVGSVTSVSSVISAGAVSTFSITGDNDTNKHRSKFNPGGAKKKKKRKKVPRRKRRGVIPGSEEELKTLVAGLRAIVAGSDAGFHEVVAETVRFLAQVRRVELARELFGGYVEMRERICKSQEKRKETERLERVEGERRARREGHNFQQEEVDLWCEGEMDSLGVPELPGVMGDVFSFI